MTSLLLLLADVGHEITGRITARAQGLLFDSGSRRKEPLRYGGATAAVVASNHCSNGLRAPRCSASLGHAT